MNEQIHFGSSIIYFDYSSFKEINRFGFLTGDKFIARDVALNVSAAGRIRRNFAWGVTLKYAFSKIDRFHAAAIAADFGVLFRSEFLNDLITGLAIRNLGQSLNAYYQEKESLPTVLSLSLSNG